KRSIELAEKQLIAAEKLEPPITAQGLKNLHQHAEPETKGPDGPRWKRLLEHLVKAECEQPITQSVRGLLAKMKGANQAYDAPRRSE
ncbi:MAG: hypothetical protein JSU88_07850, partial [Nitrospinaceae bacterium]